MSSLDPWLVSRLADAPPALRARIEAVLASTPYASSPHLAWREAADRLVAEAATGPSDRRTAMTLLAADALITLACEYVAEHEPERLAEC